MRNDKPDLNTSLASFLFPARQDAPEGTVSEALRLAGADFVSRGKVKAQAITSPGTNLCQLTGSVQCSFGIVHHPTVILTRRGSEIRVEQFQCGCREGAKGHFCAHCAAVLVAHYGHADVRLRTDNSQDAPEDGYPAGIHIRLGTQKKSAEPVYWTPEDARRLATANIAIIGQEDMGNTQMVQSVALQLLRQKAQAGEPLGILIFDGLDDYSESRTPFVEATGAKVLRLRQLPLNPFGLRGLERKPQLPSHTAIVFADALARVYGLGVLQKSTLVQAILAAYEKRGITSDPLTWDLRAPGIDEVYAEYISRPQTQRSDDLARILESLALLELFDPDAPEDASLYDLVQGAVILDMSGYSETLKHFALDIFLEMLYAQMCGQERTLNRGLQKMVLIDKADTLLGTGSPGLEGLLTQGREFGLGLLLSAQSLDVFQDDKFDYCKWIRAWVLHNVEDLRKADLEFLLQIDIYDSALERLCQESCRLRKLHSLIRISNEEPVLAEDLPFYEIAGDAAQSYLTQATDEPEPEPLAGMPLLDTESPDTLVTLEEIPAAPMSILEELK